MAKSTSSPFSPNGIARMRRTMARHADGGAMPGLVTLVSRRGETHADAHGTMTFDADAPMRRDTIFRIASCTKPIVAAAAMILVEECRLRLDEPVDELLPELADRQVLRSIGSELDDTVPAQRPISLRDLLTFRAGIGAVMVYPAEHPIQHLMDELGVAPRAELPTVEPDELLRRLGQLPLLHQPGEAWSYNTGSDILGVLIARATGGTLGTFLQERVFGPLGMVDTEFSVPVNKVGRLPGCYQTDFETGGHREFDVAGELSQFAAPPVFESGAGGLVSTADDLLAFGELLLGKGRRGDDRILSRPSVELMMTDHITPAQKAISPFVPGFWDAAGWGFGGSVVTRRDGLASIGQYGWEGGYGTSFHVDPVEGLIGVLMTQRLFDSPIPPTALFDFWTSAYAAIDD